ncbi:MAG: ABC transporter substrate-binding protein [Nocardioidaceae bacterium]|nr:ABC transporter substrate-binding protein [Nocardioidaceae bacterium]
MTSINRRRGGTLAAVAALLLAAACAPAEETSGSADATATSDAQCSPEQLDTQTAGKLTVGTDSPAYSPWFEDDDPTNGKGYESAVAYAVAKELGYAADDVTWITVPFNSSYQPGAKKFDFDINQVSITDARAKAVDFSDPYYEAAQAVVTLGDSEYDDATSFADLKDAQLGAQVGTTSLQAISQIGATKEPRVYDDSNAATQALQNGQIDGLVVDLPTAYYIAAAELDDGDVIGQFQPETGESEAFGLLFAKGSPLVPCVDRALGTLQDDGTLGDLEQTWLSQTTGVPELS